MKNRLTASLLTLGCLLSLTAPAVGQSCPNGQCPLPTGPAAAGWFPLQPRSPMIGDSWVRPNVPSIEYRDPERPLWNEPIRPYLTRDNGRAWAPVPQAREPYRGFAPVDGLSGDSPSWNRPSSATSVDPFSLPALLDDSRSRGGASPRRERPNSVVPTRYRVPRDDWGRSDQQPALQPDDLDFRLPTDNPLRPADGFDRGRDQYVPVPLPDRADETQSREIFDSITLRYQNPALLRSLRSLSSSQARQMFEEVARRIDERHMEPSSYDVRIRRALRNLSVALDNPAFLSAVQLQGNSFRLDGFRNTLSRISDASRIGGLQDALAVLATVSQEARGVGISDAVIAYEFANAQVDTLDRFSALEPLDPADARGAAADNETRSAALDEEIFGIGIEVKEHEQGLLVVKPLRNSPAAEAGLLPGDLILAINGRDLAGLPLSRSVDLLKSPSGARLSLRVAREGRGERTFAVAPRRIRIYSVDDTRLLPGTDVGYLSLSRFSQNSTSELDAALNELHQKGMKSLIVDLRGNPGGLLTTCLEISDRFLPCGTIVSTKGRLNVDTMTETATFNRTWSVPLVVLIDGDSASASEIFAAAVQENRRGIVVGTRSYGKGSVQTHFPLTSASANLRLTTALFYSPNGRKMSGTGVEPDVMVDDADGVANGDRVLVEATRLARSRTVVDLAKAAGRCRPHSGGTARSSSRINIRDDINQTIVLR